MEYQLLDVFTAERFGGNQLAVFTDASGLSDQQMQQIANEMNLAETVFVVPRESPTSPRIRIFTTADEMPFAGHPTVGTAICLAQLAYAQGDIDKQSDWLLQENVGPVPVKVDLSAAVASARFTTAQLPQQKASNLDAEQAAKLLSLPVDAVVADPVVASCGAPYTLIELQDRELLAKVKVQSALETLFFADDSWPAFYLFCRDKDDTKKVHARMFCQEINLVEDPATGSAASALSAVLAEGLCDGVHDFSISQGVDMGRASEIGLQLSKAQGEISEVAICGQAVKIGEGRLML